MPAPEGRRCKQALHRAWCGGKDDDHTAADCPVHWWMLGNNGHVRGLRNASVIEVCGTTGNEPWSVKFACDRDSGECARVCGITDVSGPAPAARMMGACGGIASLAFRRTRDGFAEDRGFKRRRVGRE